MMVLIGFAGTLSLNTLKTMGDNWIFCDCHLRMRKVVVVVLLHGADRVSRDQAAV